MHVACAHPAPLSVRTSDAILTSRAIENRLNPFTRSQNHKSTENPTLISYRTHISNVRREHTGDLVVAESRHRRHQRRDLAAEFAGIARAWLAARSLALPAEILRVFPAVGIEIPILVAFIGMDCGLSLPTTGTAPAPDYRYGIFSSPVFGGAFQSSQRRLFRGSGVSR